MNQEQLAALAKGLAPVVRECVETATAPLLEQINALRAEVEALKAIDHAVMISQSVTDAVAAVPAPKDGEPGKDADPAEIAQMVKEAVEALPKPADGKNVTVDDVKPMITDQVLAAVGKAIKSLPAPENGKDGVGLAGALIDRSGNLIVTLTDGSQRELGPVVGKDGDPGEPGVDGLGFDDIEMVIAEDGAALVFTRGEQKKAFALPIVFDRGVYKSDASYRKGNGVTWGGQFWIAQKDNPEGKPDASDDWRLAVKRGRDAPRNKAGG